MSERDKGRSSEPFWEESDVEALWLAFFFNILLVILNFRLITNRMEVWAAAFVKRCINSRFMISASLPNWSHHTPIGIPQAHYLTYFSISTNETSALRFLLLFLKESISLLPQPPQRNVWTSHLHHERHFVQRKLRSKRFACRLDQYPPIRIVMYNYSIGDSNNCVLCDREHRSHYPKPATRRPSFVKVDQKPSQPDHRCRRSLSLQLPRKRAYMRYWVQQWSQRPASETWKSPHQTGSGWT